MNSTNLHFLDGSTSSTACDWLSGLLINGLCLHTVCSCQELNTKAEERFLANSVLSPRVSSCMETLNEI